MSKQIILHDCVMPDEFTMILDCEAERTDPVILIHVANGEVTCHHANIAIGPLIGILDALKDRLLEQKNGSHSS